MADRHLVPGLKVRVPEELYRWYGLYAKAIDEPRNRVLVRALEAFREDVEAGERR